MALRPLVEQEVVKMLVDAGADVNRLAANRVPPLHEACRELSGRHQSLYNVVNPQRQPVDNRDVSIYILCCT